MTLTDGMMNRNFKFLRRWIPLLPAVFFVIAYLLPLGGRVMIRPDEFRYAEIPREMLVSGTWLNPRLDGVKYFEKPTLGYQLIALSMCAFGENKFAVRLPSAFGTLLAAAMIYLICRHESRSRFCPAAAASIFLASGLVYGIGTFAVLDAAFSGAVTVSIGAFWLACRSNRVAERAGWLAAAGTAAAFAFMLKGFLAFALPAIVAAPFLIWNREWKKLFVFPWLPLALILLIAIPWALTQHRAEPDFWRYFFVEEHWKRFTSGTYDRKAQPFWYFIPILLGGVLPAGLLWIAGAIGCTKEWFKRPFVRYMICWTVFPFLLFSASSCKLGTYILPCFPPLAMLLISALKNARKIDRVKLRERLLRLCRISGAVLIAVSAAGLVAAAVLMCIPDLLPGCIGSWTILTLGALLIFGMALRRRKAPGAIAMLQTFLLGLAPVACFGMLAVPGLGERTPERGLRECLRHFPDHAECRIAVERTCIASVCWVTQRDDIIVAGNKLGELKYGIENHRREYAGRHFDDRHFPTLVRDTKPGKLLYVTFYDLRKRPLPKNWPQPLERRSAHGVTILRF